MFRLSHLRIFVLLSLGLHSAIAAWFFNQPVTQFSRPHKGVVSVELVESVDHSAKVISAIPKMPKPTQPIRRPEKNSVNPAEPAPQNPVTGPAGDPNGDPNAANEYISLVTNLINTKKIYPQLSIEREEEGRVIVAVSISRDGNVLAVTVESGCHYQRLNLAAVQTVNSLGKFPSVPIQLPEPLHLHIPLVYSITR